MSDREFRQPFHNKLQPQRGSCWAHGNDRRIVGEKSWNGSINYYDVSSDSWKKTSLKDWVEQYQNFAKEVKDIRKWGNFIEKEGFCSNNYEKTFLIIKAKYLKKKKVPNYSMLQFCLVDTNDVKQKFPELDQMPKPHIRPGFDINLMKPLAVLNYICGVDSQWSCQGNHKNGIVTAYILLYSGEYFPLDLLVLLENNNFYIGLAKDYDEDLNETGKYRINLRSNWNDDVLTKELIKENNKLIKLLDSWADEKRAFLRKNRNFIL